MCILKTQFLYLPCLSLWIHAFLALSQTHTLPVHPALPSKHNQQIHTHFQLSTGFILYTQVPVITHKHSLTQTLLFSSLSHIHTHTETYTNTLIPSSPQLHTCAHKHAHTHTPPLHSVSNTLPRSLTYTHHTLNRLHTLSPHLKCTSSSAPCATLSHTPFSWQTYTPWQ